MKKKIVKLKKETRNFHLYRWKKEVTLTKLNVEMQMMKISYKLENNMEQ